MSSGSRHPLGQRFVSGWQPLFPHSYVFLKTRSQMSDYLRVFPVVTSLVGVGRGPVLDALQSTFHRALDNTIPQPHEE